jgi:hypothetical protein
MKKQFFMAAAFVTATVCANTLTAQTTEKKASWNLKENVKCRVSSSSSGCDVSFTKSPRDVASGLATGKRQHKPVSFSVSSSDNTVTENTVATTASAKSSGQGAGKASFSDLSVMITIKGKSQKLDVTDGEFSLPEDCPDGVCDMVCSWSWGASNSGSAKSCSVGFSIEIENGVCQQINKSKSNVKNN